MMSKAMKRQRHNDNEYSWCLQDFSDKKVGQGKTP